MVIAQVSQHAWFVCLLCGVAWMWILKTILSERPLRDSCLVGVPVNCDSCWTVCCWRSLSHTHLISERTVRGLECTTCGCVREGLVGDVVCDDGACYNLSEVSSETAGARELCASVPQRDLCFCPSYRSRRWVMPPRRPSWATTRAMTSSRAWFLRTPTRRRLWWISWGPCAGTTSPRWRQRAITERAAWTPSFKNPGKTVRWRFVWECCLDLLNTLTFIFEFKVFF